MWVLIFIIIMMWSDTNSYLQATIPEKAPKGVEKIKLGYFKNLHGSGIYGDMIKLNDGRVLIYRITGNQTYIFDPKDDSFRRTAITDAPAQVNDKLTKGHNYNYRNHTKLGVTLNNGKVLILPPKSIAEIDEISYYNNNIDDNTPEWELIRNYYDNKTKENQEKAIAYIRENKPELYNRYKKYKEYKEDAKHAHLYNPETEKMETIDIPPFTSDYKIYKLLLKDGRVLLVNDSAAALYNPDNNKFTQLPNDHKVIGHACYTVLSDGLIFMVDYHNNDTPYLYDMSTDTLIKKDPKKFNGKALNDNRFVQFEDDRLCFLHRSEDDYSVSLFCYNPHTEESTLTPLINSNFKQIMQKLQDGSILLTGKYYDGPYNYRTGSENRPEYHVQWINPSTQKTKVLTKKVHYTHASGYTQHVLLDDGRILFRNTDHTKDGYELFIPYSYKKQKQKHLKSETKKDLK